MTEKKDVPTLADLGRAFVKGLQESVATTVDAPVQAPAPPPTSRPENVTRLREADAAGTFGGYSVTDLYRIAHDAEDRSQVLSSGSLDVDGVAYLDFVNAHDAVGYVCAAGPRAIIDLLNALGFADVDPGPTSDDDYNGEPVGS